VRAFTSTAPSASAHPRSTTPFLLLDDFRSDKPSEYRAGFPWHPHRGMETITYMLKGEVEHRDSLGNRGVISPGDVQWMSAGSGIIHQEMPKGDENGAMYGVQLWANLPASSKMSEPRYRGIVSDEIPVAKDAASGTVIRVIAGTVNGVTGAVRDVVTRPEYLDVTVPPGATFAHPTPLGHTVFALTTKKTRTATKRRATPTSTRNETTSSAIATSCSSPTETPSSLWRETSRCAFCSYRGCPSRSPSHGVAPS
jgi:redox-sensitive bicupin YhaK (pirin superfamily)